MKHSLTVGDLSQIDDAAKSFLRETEGNRLIALHAEMGGGKTTFTSALCRALGVNGDAVSSPTFSIVNEYKAGDGSAIFHFDFYRIEKIEEVLDIGFYDYIDSGALCIMEWPEKIEEILPEEVLRVDISISPDGARILEWED